MAAAGLLLISAAGAVGSVAPASAAAGAPSVTFQTPSTSGFSATLTSTVNRGERQISTITCALTRVGGLTSTATCGLQTATSSKSMTLAVTLSGLNVGEYTYAVTVAMPDGSRVTGTRRFTIAAVRPDCTVSPYVVPWDGAPHTATGSCTGVGGVALPSSHLDLGATTHTNPGSYTDSWSFSDPSGHYSARSGTVNNAIGRRSQTITFGAGSADVTVGGSYTPTATASSGLPVTFSVNGASASICSLSNGVVSFGSVGTCTVDGNQAGNGTWSPAPLVQQALTIVPRSQTITFGAGPTAPQVGGSYTPTATATSGLALTFTVSSASAATCSLANGVVSFNAPGSCTVVGNQPGNSTWAPAPVVQQTFTIAAPAPPPLSLIPTVLVNIDETPQSPPLPPNPAANQCNPQTLIGGGCAIEELDGTVDNFFDASHSIDPNADPSRDTITYHWELFKPPTLSGTPYSSSGITGDRAPVLRIRPSSLPSLSNSAAGTDTFWRVRLTITLNDNVTTSWFRFGYLGSSLTLQMSTDCQRIGHLQGNECTSTAINGLPRIEPLHPGGQTITFGAPPIAPRVGGHYTPTATATSGLPVDLAIIWTDSACYLLDGVVTFRATGTCRVTARQWGDQDWPAGPIVEQTFTIAPA